MVELPTWAVAFLEHGICSSYEVDVLATPTLASIKEVEQILQLIAVEGEDA
jgi:S-methylmethionine-dependent homocysteine/selenocysteine methylase